MPHHGNEQEQGQKVNPSAGQSGKSNLEEPSSEKTTDYGIDVLPNESMEPNASPKTKMDTKFQLDVLQMRLEAAKDILAEVEKDWLVRQTLIDKNKSLLESLDLNVLQHEGDLQSAKAMSLEMSARLKALKDEIAQLTLAHADQIQLAAQLEATLVGEKNMREEIQRRIRNHSTGIAHIMAEQRKRSLAVQELRIKAQRAELELMSTDALTEEPAMYHPDYMATVQIPTTVQTNPEPGAPPEKLSPEQLPGYVASSQSIVTLETPPYKEDLEETYLRHMIPIESGDSFFKKIEESTSRPSNKAPMAPPVGQRAHPIPNRPPDYSDVTIPQTLPTIIEAAADLAQLSNVSIPISSSQQPVTQRRFKTVKLGPGFKRYRF